jgi:hypothetical protein
MFKLFNFEDLDFNLLFDLQTQFSCELISFYNSRFTIENVNFIGSLSFFNCSVVIGDSQLTHNQVDNDLFFFADQKTTLIGSNTIIDAKCKNVISSQNESLARFTNCQIQDVKKAMLIQNHCKCFLIHCNLKNNQYVNDSNFVDISNTSNVNIIECSFEKCSKIAITVSKNLFSNILYHYVIVKDNSQIVCQNSNFSNVTTNSFRTIERTYYRLSI